MLINIFRKHAGLITLLGLLLFIPTYIIITVQLNQSGHIEEISAALNKMDMNELKTVYINNPTPAAIHILDYILIIGYVTMTTGLLTYYKVHNNEQKKLNTVNSVMIGIVLFGGIADIIETTIISIAGAVNFNIPNYLMLIHVIGTYLKGLFWVVLLWTIIIAIVLFIQRSRKKPE